MAPKPTPVVLGIDVSHFQHGLSLAAVRAHGYEFVIAKATEGRGFQDSSFQDFREEANSVGLLFAAYHFLHSNSPAGRQADNLAEQLDGDTHIPVMIDCEPTDGSSPTLVDVKRFIAACEKRDLRVSILYLPHFHWQRIGQPKLHGLPPVMQALYGKNLRGPGKALYPGNESPRWGEMGGATPTLLQFGSKGRIPGFEHLKVDVGAFRGKRADLVASGMFFAPQGTKAAKTAAAKKAVAKKAVAKKVAKKVPAKKLAHTDDIPIMWRGHKLNARTILMLQAAERRLGERVVITEGSFNPDVKASAGTHDRGGVLDLSVKTGGAPTQRKVRVLRKEGFAAWHRLPKQFKPEDHVPEHIHAVSLFDHALSTQAGKQKTSYLADPTLDALATPRPDGGPVVPVPAKPTLTKQTVRRREILFQETNDSVGYLQDVLGLIPDRFFGKQTKRFMMEQFGWNGKKPMTEPLFRKLFPEVLFVLDATVPAAKVAPAPAAAPAAVVPAAPAAVVPAEPAPAVVPAEPAPAVVPAEPAAAAPAAVPAEPAPAAAPAAPGAPAEPAVPSPRTKSAPAPTRV